MSIEQLRDSFKDYAKDVRLNLGSILSPEGAPGLTQSQIHGVALASAYATRSPSLVEAVLAETAGSLGDAEREAAKAAATIMAQNNVYYRFLHLIEDPSFKTMPARLRMNVIGSPGIAKVDFELYSLAVSILNACSSCVNAHAHEVKKAGLANEAIHSTARIASVIQSAAQAISIG